jgi:acyl-CoA dehydrogenase
MDTVGNKIAKKEIAMIKVLAPTMACQVIDWAMQVHGGGGVSEDFGLAHAYAHARTLRFADGPDEVHRNAIAKLEIGEQTTIEQALRRPK